MKARLPGHTLELPCISPIETPALLSPFLPRPCAKASSRHGTMTGDCPSSTPPCAKARSEIAEMLVEHLNQFIAGERDFDDAISTDDFILPVEVWPDGTIQIEDGRRFGKQEN